MAPKLSICVTVKNRNKVQGKYLFPNTIRSIVNSVRPGEAEICVSDWNSTDYPIKSWIYTEARGVPVKIVNISKPGFNRGLGLNAAASKATSKILLFTDADILLNREIIELAKRIPFANTAYFPRVRLTTHTGTPVTGGRLWLRGCAIAIVMRDWWQKIQYRTQYWYGPKNWGGEDNDFYDDIEASGIKVMRPEMPNIIHQWHPRKVVN